MNAVVNATPLISLALLGRLSLLNEMFDAIIVPRPVYMGLPVKGTLGILLAAVLAGLLSRRSVG